MVLRSPSFATTGLTSKRSVDDGEDADGGEREAYGAGGPVVAVVGVDDVDVHERLLRDVSEEKNGGDGQHGAALEQRERADWIGALPGEGAAVLVREGFGQNEEAVESVDETQSRRRPRRAGAD